MVASAEVGRRGEVEDGDGNDAEDHQSSISHNRSNYTNDHCYEGCDTYGFPTRMKRFSTDTVASISAGIPTTLPPHGNTFLILSSFAWNSDFEPTANSECVRTRSVEDA